MHKVVAALVGVVSIGVTACVMSGPKNRKNIHKIEAHRLSTARGGSQAREKRETLAEIGRSYNVSGCTISRLRHNKRNSHVGCTSPRRNRVNGRRRAAELGVLKLLPPRPRHADEQQPVVAAHRPSDALALR